MNEEQIKLTKKALELQGLIMTEAEIFKAINTFKTIERKGNKFSLMDAELCENDAINYPNVFNEPIPEDF